MHPAGSLRKQVIQKFAAARASQDLIFSDTHLTIVCSKTGIPFQLRWCPALSKKPVQTSTSDKPKEKKPDPFENPSAELLINTVSTRGHADDRPISGSTLNTDGATHNLVLNKYPVIHNHFILTTKSYKPQTDLLEADDLSLSLACLKLWRAEDVPGSLFAFFNSGKNSGASQPHRHLQFLPIEDMKGSTEDEWDILCDRLRLSARHNDSNAADHAGLPFACFATAIESDITPNCLHRKYLSLLKRAYIAVQEDRSLTDVTTDRLLRGVQSTFSYNLAMTCNVMAILPRRNESCSLPGIVDSLVSVNGTILGGTLMVKLEAELQAIQKDPSLLDYILKNITFPVSEAVGRRDTVSKY